MALSKSQIQKLWRARRDLKAKFFEAQDAERRAQLDFPASVTNKPEGVALEAFFRNYPLCYKAPAALRLQDGGWVVVFRECYEMVLAEAAAAIVALREISSLPVSVEAAGQSPVSPSFLADMAAETKADVRDMRAARMWGAQ